MNSLPRIPNFKKSPAPEAAMIINGRNPERFSSLNLGCLFALQLPGDFNDEIEQISSAMGVINPDNKIRVIALFFAIEGIRNCETDILVLHIAMDFLHVFERLGNLLFPRICIGDDVGNMAFIGTRAEHSTHSIKVDVPGGPLWIIRVKEGLQPFIPFLGTHYSMVNPFSGFMGKLAEQQHLNEGIIFAL